MHKISQCNLFFLHLSSCVLASLQKDFADKKKLLEGARKLKQVAALIYSNRQADVDPHQLTLVNVV
jgi:hypothetical protein